MIRAALLLCVGLAAGCDSRAPRPAAPTPAAEPGIHVSGEARVGVVYGN